MYFTFSTEPFITSKYRYCPQQCTVARLTAVLCYLIESIKILLRSRAAVWCFHYSFSRCFHYFLPPVSVQSGRVLYSLCTRHRLYSLVIITSQVCIWWIIDYVSVFHRHLHTHTHTHTHLHAQNTDTRTDTENSRTEGFSSHKMAQYQVFTNHSIHYPRHFMFTNSFWSFRGG